MPDDMAIPRKAPPRSSSRKRARRAPAQPLNPAVRQAQINAYYDLKKNSPALKQARVTRMKRLNQAKWAAAQAQIPVQWRAVMVVFRVLIMSLVLFVMFRIMLREKQLLKIKSLLTRQTLNLQQSKMSWRSFDHAYEMRFGRPTPAGLEQWLTFAEDNDCEPFKLYTAIERDLAPFRKQITTPVAKDKKQSATAKDVTSYDIQPLHWNSLQDIATNYTKGAYLLVQIKDHQLTILDRQLHDWFQQHPTVHKQDSWRGWWEMQKLEWNVKWLLDPLLQHTPPLTTRFVINLHNKPRSPTNAVVPIFSSHSESYHTNDDPDHPGNMNLEIANKNRNGVIDTRDPTTRDLLLPHLLVAGGRMGAAGMTSSPAIGGFWFWPFFRQGKPWHSRLNSIVWRGSTLGTFERGNKTRDFFTGPRFEMMKKWNPDGTKEVHPIQSDIPVNVDFAFTKLLLQNEEVMDPNQKGAIQSQVKADYRFASRLSYRQLQKYKYLMDVDGNAFSVRFSALLRSGSLIFKATRYREWFSERIRSWKDYIPVDYDTSDLARKLEWANSQPPEVIENIIQHARDTVERHIRPEDMQCYTYRMILEYTTLFNETSFDDATTADGTRRKQLRD